MDQTDVHRTFYPTAAKYTLFFNTYRTFSKIDHRFDHKISHKNPRIFYNEKNLQDGLTRGDFPGGPVVKNSPCNAEDMSSIPGQGTKIPHAVEPLSLCTPNRPSSRQGKILHDATRTWGSQIN